MNRTAILVTALAALVTFALWDTYQRGVAAGRGAVAGQQVKVWTETLVVRDSVYVRDTTRLRVFRDRWDTAYVDVERWKHDTIKVIEYVRQADSTIKVCTAVLQSCEQRVAARDSVIRGLRDIVKQKEAATPSTVRLWLERGLWLAAGVGVGQIIPR